jgi:hypothetical protein
MHSAFRDDIRVRINPGFRRTRIDLNPWEYPASTR